MTDGGLDRFARAVDAVTGYGGVAVLAAIICAGLLVRHRIHAAVVVGVSVAGAMAGNIVLKRVVARPRPDTVPAGMDVSEWSFPSGHAAATAALAVAVVLVMDGHRGLVAPLAAAYAVIAGGAQLVLGLHHPTDVLGGWLWAAAWTTGVWLVARRTQGGSVERVPP